MPSKKKTKTKTKIHPAEAVKLFIEVLGGPMIEVYTVKSAAKATGMTEQAIYAMKLRGSVSSYVVFGTIFVNAHEVRLHCRNGVPTFICGSK